jgi:hypothetical protein
MLKKVNIQEIKSLHLVIFKKEVLKIIIGVEDKKNLNKINIQLKNLHS